MIYTTRLVRIDGTSGDATPLAEHMLGSSWDQDDTRNGGYGPKLNLTEAEFKAIDHAIAAIERCSHGFAYEVVERNYADLVSTHRFVTLSLGLGRSFGTPDRLGYARSVMSATVNWLSSIHLFLDHARTDLSRRQGKDSPELTRFVEATNRAYDSRPGYRFAYRLRNYVLHCGLPASTLNGTVVDKRTEVAILLNRDELLDGFDWGPHVTADLEAGPDQFELGPLAEDAMAGLREINHELMLIHLEDAAAAVPALTAALEQLDAAGIADHPTLFLAHEQTDEAVWFSARRFSRDSVHRLSQVHSGDKTAEDLINPPVPPTPVLQPENVAGIVHREARAVQVMTAWYSTAPERDALIARTINAIIAADDNVEPVITGLMNLCGVLAAMAAIGSNRTSEGLLADLVGQYATLANQSEAPGDT